MLVTPVSNFDGISLSSRALNSVYEVWRRWEDCLWFQETIELEYERLARQKRQRLFKGKGVKKNGMYLQDQAASFESLPPGPDPHSIAENIHDTIPKLTKKGTLFRASQATIDQRQRELTALIEGLLQDDVPTLIQELRTSRIVTDFFGYWRRDYDLAQKKNPLKDARQRNSVSSSVFSMYFSQSSISDRRDSAIPPVPQSPSCLSVSTSSRPRAFSSATTSSTLSSSAPSSRLPYKSHNLSSDEDLPRSSASQSSSCSSSGPSSRDSQGSIISSMSYLVPDDASIVIDHNSKLISDYPFSLSRPSIALESLPEDPDSTRKTDSNPPPVRTRMRRSSSTSDHPHRSVQIYGTPPQSTESLEPRLPADQQSLAPSRRSVRESWVSGTSMLDGLNVSLDDSPVLPNRRIRDSMSSISTFMTANSAEAVIPLSLTASPDLRRSLSSGTRRYRPMSLSEDDYSELDDDILDPYFYDEFPMPQPLPSTPASRYAAIGQLSPRLTRSSVHLSPVPPSPTGSTFTAVSQFSQSSSFSNGTGLSLKVAYQNTIVLLRTPADSTLASVRARLEEKFAGQDIILPSTWVLNLVLPTPHANGPADARSPTVKARGRANSLASVTDENRMRAVRTQQEWERIVMPMEGTKLNIRILDADTR
ncbi:hypothetical protein HGRIS_003351 [Hohenbuehelia grisea]